MKIIAFIFFVIIGFNSKAQLDYGFMGRKNLISFSTYSGVSLIYMMRTNGFYYYNYDPYYYDRPWIRVDYKLEYQRLLSKNVSVGLEVGYSNQRMRSQAVSIYTDEIYDYLHAALSPNFHTYTLSPTISFARERSLSFSGFSFQLGIGPSFHKLNIKRTRFDSNVFNTLDEMVVSPEKLFVGLTTFMHLNYKFSLTKDLFLDLGMRIKGDFHFGHSRRYTSVDVYNVELARVHNSNLRHWLQQRGLYDVFSLKLGVSYQF